MKGFIVVHDEPMNNRLTFIKKKAIMSIAENLKGRAVIAYGNDIVVETGECLEDVMRMMRREEL